MQSATSANCTFFSYVTTAFCQSAEANLGFMNYLTNKLSPMGYLVGKDFPEGT